MSDTAMSKRTKACERCWRRKQKCNRLLPTCSTCAALNLTCVGRQLDLEATSDDTTIAASDVPIYVASLRRRLEELKGHRSNPSKRVRLNSMTTILKPNDARTSPASVHSPDVTRVQATMGEIGFLSRSAMSESRHDVSQFPYQLRTENIVKLVTWSDDTDTSHEALLNPMRSATSTILLDEKRTASQLHAFLENASGLLLQLQAQDIMKAYDNLVNEQKSDHKAAQSGLSAVDNFKVYLSIAIGSLYSNQSHRTTTYAEQMFGAAILIFGDIVKTHSAIAVVDCMLYLIMYSTLTMPAESTWHLIALATRLSTSAGLHKEPDGEHGTSDSDMPFMRKLFWSLYSLDRSLAVIMDRPFSIQDSDVTLLPPDLNQMPQHSFTQSILDHSMLISSLRENAHKGVAFHFGSYCSWRDTMPNLETLENKTRATLEQLDCRSASQLQSAYNAHPKYRSIIREPLAAVVRRGCLAFVNAMHEKMDTGSFIVTNVLGYDLFWAGISLLSHTEAIASGAQTAQFAANGAEKCLTLLTIVGERFPDMKPLRRALHSASVFCRGGNTEMLNQDFIQKLPAVVPRTPLERLRHINRHIATPNIATSRILSAPT